MTWSGNRHEQYSDYVSMMTVHTDQSATVSVQIREQGVIREMGLTHTQVETLVRQLQDWLERTKV